MNLLMADLCSLRNNDVGLRIKMQLILLVEELGDLSHDSQLLGWSGEKRSHFLL